MRRRRFQDRRSRCARGAMVAVPRERCRQSRTRWRHCHSASATGNGRRRARPSRTPASTILTEKPALHQRRFRVRPVHEWSGRSERPSHLDLAIAGQRHLSLSLVHLHRNFVLPRGINHVSALPFSSVVARASTRTACAAAPPEDHRGAGSSLPRLRDIAPARHLPRQAAALRNVGAAVEHPDQP